MRKVFFFILTSGAINIKQLLMLLHIIHIPNERFISGARNSCPFDQYSLDLCIDIDPTSSIQETIKNLVKIAVHLMNYHLFKIFIAS